jgi:hypothetical protein
VAIDRSFSMGAPSRFERARNPRAGRPSTRPAAIASASSPSTTAPISSPAPARRGRRARRWPTSPPGFGGTRYAAAVDKATELLADEVHARLVVVTDLQRSGFDESGAVLPERIELSVLDAGAQATNLSVSNATIDRRRVTATVRNYGGTPRTADVRATIDDRQAPARQVTIPANDALDVTFDAAADATRATLSVDDADGYAADNDRFAITESRTLPRVLIVGGGPGAASGFYLTRALQADAEEGADFDVRSVTGSAFAAMTADQLHEQSVVALLSTHGIDRRAGEPLRTFLKRGGGLFVAVAPDVDAAVLSALLDWQPPLLPRDIRAPGMLAATDLRHPVFRPFDAVAANFGQVLVERAWHIDAGSAWRVVARFTDGAPALVERIGPDARILLFTSDVDRRWNDFPLHPAFVPFAQEVVRYLGAHPPAVSAYLVGDVPAGIAPSPGIVRAGERTLAVNVDPRESRVDRVTPAEFQQLVTRSSAETRPRAERLRAAGREPAELLALRVAADAGDARRRSLRRIAMMMDLGTSLDRIRRRWRTAEVLRAAARAMMAVALIAAAAALTARWTAPSDGALMALAALATILCLAIVGLAAWPLRRRPDDRQVARYVEEHCPSSTTRCDSGRHPPRRNRRSRVRAAGGGSGGAAPRGGRSLAHLRSHASAQRRRPRGRLAPRRSCWPASRPRR